MKRFAAATCLVLAANTATAGGYEEPMVMPPVVIVEETQASSMPVEAFVFMVWLVMVAAAASN